jgi:D-glycero-D-manno-heptose 1,7-bisphosphate phosphatase
VAAAAPRAVLLDRDGTINVKAPEGEYITAPEQLELLPGAGEAIAELARAGVPVVVVTNQRGIARGLMTEADLAAVHGRLSERLRVHGGHITAYLHCPHERGTCDCRKPGTLMLRQAQELVGLDSLADTVMIGDAVSDVEAGRRAGARSILLRAGGDSRVRGWELAPTLLDAVRTLLS